VGKVIPFPGSYPGPDPLADSLADSGADPGPDPDYAWPTRPKWVLPADDAPVDPDDDRYWDSSRVVQGPDDWMRLYIDLVDAAPRISREVMVPSGITMDLVHEVIVAAMGWQDYHLHAFIQGGVDDPLAPRLLTEADIAEGEEGLLESEVRLFEVLRANGDEVGHEYDFGDGWRHVVRLIACGDDADAIPPGDPVWAVADRDADPEARVRLIDGHGACPPEDVGGIHYYNQVAAWLRGEPGARIDEPEQLRAWLPEGFDPDVFDINAAQNRLAATRAGGRLDLVALSDRVAEALVRLGSARGELASLLVGAELPRHGERHVVDTLSDADVARAARPWLRLLGEIPSTGLKLTAAGYLPPAVVARVYADFGFAPDAVWGKANREDNVPTVRDLREAAVAIGLLRKARGHLHVTAEGRAGQADPRRLVARVVSRMPFGSQDYERDAGLLALAALASLADYPPHIAEAFWPSRLHDALELFGAFGWRQGWDPVPDWVVGRGAYPTLAALTRMGGFTCGRYGEPGMPCPLGPALARAALCTPRSAR